MSEKKIQLKKEDYDVIDGKVVLKNEELNNLISETSYDVNSEPGNGGVSVTITKF